MDADLYDEFGNYIGPELDESSESSDWIDEEDEMDIQDVEPDDAPSKIIPYQDRQYYPDAEEVYPDAEVTVQEEDTRTIDEPIIAPVDKKKFEYTISSTEWLPTTYTKEYMESLMTIPDRIRCIAFAGHIHHGKSSFVGKLIDETHHSLINLKKKSPFTDHRFDEQDRAISLRSAPVSVVLPDSQDKSYLFHIIDTPGHVNFNDEATAAFRLCDGIVLVVDVVEGKMVNNERMIRHAVQNGLKIVLVLNKIDRLILELKLPPQDAYYKIKHTLDDMNEILETCIPDPDQFEAARFSPEKGNVCFASTEHCWSFTLEHFANIYIFKNSKNNVNSKQFSRHLWGNIWMDPRSRVFSSNKPKRSDIQRSFIQFVLEPLYKIYGRVVGEEPDQLEIILKKLGVNLTKQELRLDVHSLIKIVMGRFIGISRGFVDMVTEYIPSPIQAINQKLEFLYTGPLDSKRAEAMLNMDPDGPLMINISKVYPSADCSEFYALGKVLSGTVTPGVRVKVLGENYEQQHEEDMTLETISRIFIGMTRYQINVNSATPGNFIMMAGVDASINKTASIVDIQYGEPAYIFRPLQFCTTPVVKIAVEPLNPSELPKMLSGIRKINKTYPIVSTKVEESGELVILGTGELYLDTIMYDLRKLYAQIEIKVANPVVTFCETVVETSALRCFASTPNKKNKITMIAEPLVDGISKDIETGRVSMNMSGRDLSNFFRENYQWDIVSSRNIWAFGPDNDGPNVLVNTCNPTEVPRTLLLQEKNSIVQGFQWAAREGPLCEEPIRNVKFELVHANICEEPMYRGGNQIIPTARRVAYSAFLTAKPRLMEPVYYVEIQCPSECLPAIFNVLYRRRGHVVEDLPKVATPLYTVKAYIPVIDSFGFETDLRAHTQGLAFCCSVFDHWTIVPGDPLDSTIVLRPLEDAPQPHLARDFMVKTRRRKGLSEDVSRSKFFDEDFLANNQDLDLTSYIL
eukprot:TRINITY_DN8076_c0_g1_i1.p1 TRINITY_DN8076_c0_g1~~TRINITY_DN8076_c0_g1_i1.p1  ORF type:complete len:985 (+),score=218.40 TRINITY_DN8076_c0_g1_i1:51-2957(+)